MIELYEEWYNLNNYGKVKVVYDPKFVIWKKRSASNFYENMLGQYYRDDNKVDPQLFKHPNWSRQTYIETPNNPTISFDVVIVAGAGRSNGRTISHKTVKALGKRYNTVCVGYGLNNSEEYNIEGVCNLINKTSMQQLIDIICSAKLVIGWDGFCTWLSIMNNINTIQIKNVRGGFINAYYDPNWTNLNIVTKEADIMKYIKRGNLDV